MISQILTNEAELNFGDAFETLLQDATRVRIASGYIGHSAFVRVQKRLREIVSTGGSVSITIGLGYFEGLTAKMINALREFDEFCRAIDPESGVNACVSVPYHGKLYEIELSTGEVVVSVGSSNFSSTGFGDWWEGNLITSEAQQVVEVQGYLSRILIENAIPIAGVEFIVRGRKKKKSKNKIRADGDPPLYLDSIPDASVLPFKFSIPLRVTERSNFNQYLTSRKSFKSDPSDKHLPEDRRRKIEVYKPRPWYEMEMTIQQRDISVQLRDFLPNQIEKHEVGIVTQDGRYIRGVFKRKTNSPDDRRTLKEAGLDFMTSPRSHLGYVLKNALIDEGLLSFGEPVTEEILRDAEMDKLNFYQLPDGNLLMTF